MASKREVDFSKKFSDLLTKAGIPEGHGRYSRASKMLGGCVNRYRDRCLYGKLPQDISDFQSEVDILLKHVKSLHGEEYDVNPVVEWLIADGESPFTGLAKLDKEILRAVKRVADNVCIEMGVDAHQEFSAGQLEDLYHDMHNVAQYLVDKHSTETYLFQLLKNKEGMNMFKLFIEKMIESSKSRKSSGRGARKKA